jgi:hypothetical protein
MVQLNQDLIFSDYSNSRGKHEHKTRVHPNVHFFQSPNSMPLKSKHVVNPAIYTLNG